MFNEDEQGKPTWVSAAAVAPDLASILASIDAVKSDLITKAKGLLSTIGMESGPKPPERSMTERANASYPSVASTLSKATSVERGRPKGYLDTHPRNMPRVSDKDMDWAVGNIENQLGDGSGLMMMGAVPRPSAARALEVLKNGVVMEGGPEIGTLKNVTPQAARADLAEVLAAGGEETAKSTQVSKPDAISAARSAPDVEVSKLTLEQSAGMKRWAPNAPGFRWTMLPKAARPEAVASAILKDGGYTVHPTTGAVLEVGTPGPTIVGMFPNSSSRTLVVPEAQFGPEDVKRFFTANRDIFSKDPAAQIGGWKSNGNIYLDVSKQFANVREATKFGELQNPGAVAATRRGEGAKTAPRVWTPTGVERDPQTGQWPKAQEAVFHPETMAEPPINNWYDWATSQEPLDRLQEMAERGRNVMLANPSGKTNWWDLRGGPVERVYGKENLDMAAGMTAVMSPQNAPRPNMQMASEFIRRAIKNEPMMQEDWRAPADAMGGEGFTPKPGAPFPGQKNFAKPAELVRTGRGAEIGSDKRNDMRAALLGEPVGVYDRHYAKLFEKPEAGIYLDSRSNSVPGAMDTQQIEAYPVIENVVRTAAKKAGAPLDEYSAWVWEGIRDTIRTTGELFGQKHRASAVPNTTTGFNEVFEDLLTDVAEHRKISVPELEKLLRSGDASLLTAILSTGIGMEALRRSQATRQTHGEGSQR